MAPTSFERTLTTSISTAAGSLRAGIWVPSVRGPVPGIVLVHGSGDGRFDDWGEWPSRLTEGGFAVIAHDKPGCGSPGDWREQTFADRAHESLAALRVLRAHPSVAGRPVGLFGMSQGGWVSLLAAALQEEHVDFVVSLSGPGVSPSVQDRVRIERELVAEGIHADAMAEALAWLDERAARLRRGDEVRAVLEAQAEYAGRVWYETATRYFDTPQMLSFLARALDFEPAEVLPKVGCPVLAVFGGADQLVPVRESVEVFARCLLQLPGDPHGLAIFPGADHGLLVADPQPGLPGNTQLAPGFLPMLEAFVQMQRTS
ncbi:alpha/beta hydrolase family protein [Actinopolymorpha rutila]|uniref:AB hydrolase-1 domain-containing protein n=1 Tax=Actinopolymorpha rutila TaxID=446787 RepID=A0A852ZKL1_9ACTN|nr:alpha/beta hydrolase [Actinopolymorpha rutila]NYH92438.1 hypothetical protein [Actinopolymorpha rutila]